MNEPSQGKGIDPRKLSHENLQREIEFILKVNHVKKPHSYFMDKIIGYLCETEDGREIYMKASKLEFSAVMYALYSYLYSNSIRPF